MRRELVMDRLIRNYLPYLKLSVLVLGTLLLFGCSGAQKGNADAGQIFINLSESLPALWKLVTGGAYLMGVSFAARAVWQMRQYGELRSMMSTQTNLKGIIILFVVAAVFMYLPEAFAVIMQSSFGYSSPQSALSYSGPSVGGLSAEGMTAVIQLVQFTGLVAFVRGWLLIVKSAQPGQQTSISKGITHIIGGVLTINIVGTEQVIAATLGFT